MPKRGQRLLLAACIALIFGAHLLYGALTAEASLAVDAGWAVLLIVATLLPHQSKAQLPALAGLPGLFFGLVIAAAAWSLTPYSPDGVHAIWKSVGSRGSASIDRSATLLEIVKLLGLGCAFWTGVKLGKDSDAAGTVCAWISYVGAAFALVLLILSINGLILQTQGHRLEGFFLNPNTAGTVLGVILCCCVARVLSVLDKINVKRKRLELALSIVVAITVLIALLLTDSRGALAATILALAVLTALQGWSRNWTLRDTALKVGAGVLVLAAFAGYGFTIDRFSELGRDSQLRHFIFSTGWTAFKDAPLMGYGLGTFDTVSRSRLTEETYSLLWNIRSAENVYLQWLVEGGLIGATFMFLCIGSVFLVAARHLRQSRSRSALHALFAADIIFIVHGLFDFGLQTPSVSLFWAFLLGLQLAYATAKEGRSAS